MPFAICWQSAVPNILQLLNPCLGLKTKISLKSYLKNTWNNQLTPTSKLWFSQAGRTLKVLCTLIQAVDVRAESKMIG